jgi:hypothetical protein
MVVALLAIDLSYSGRWAGRTNLAPWLALYLTVLVNHIQLVIGDNHEMGEKSLPDGEQVFVGWLPFEGGGEVMGHFQEACDCVGCHFG